MWQWWNSIISGEVPLAVNPPMAFLVEKSILDENAKLVSSGALSLSTTEGKAKRHVVTDSFSLREIDWGAGIEKMNTSQFSKLRDGVLKSINFFKPQTYILEGVFGGNPKFAFGVRVISTSAIRALTCHHLLFENHQELPLGIFTIYQVAELKFDLEELGMMNSPLLVLNFESKEIISVGSTDVGVIGDALFSVAGALLPDFGVMLFKSSGFIFTKNHTSLLLGPVDLFFPFLEYEQSSYLTAFGQLGICDQGLFPLTCGESTSASNINPHFIKHHFGTVLVNFHFDLQKRQIAWAKDKKKEKGKIYFNLPQLRHWSQAAQKVQTPIFIFLFIHDYCGVMPAVSKLTLDQALFYLRSELFESPYLLRRSADYQNLLKTKLENLPVHIWLINTGYYGSGAESGEKYPTDFLKHCLESIQSSEVKEGELELEIDPIFHYAIPRGLPGVNQRLLNPMKLWQDEENYQKEAVELRSEIESLVNKVKIKKESNFQLPY